MDDLGTVLRRDNMDDALSVVYEVAETGDGTVEWCDVSQRLDQERWGELLRTGVLMVSMVTMYLSQIYLAQMQCYNMLIH